ncbi:thiolase domain-containing protein [Tomitella gaofuii]|uniref:thiolase domain-containing protein n=1 Tax=Tomitella gaofuii TaxID=2760083 RepID=UPI0015FD892F|nr:thiolase domain-containing protein [Tomitella gaofuii]
MTSPQTAARPGALTPETVTDDDVAVVGFCQSPSVRRSYSTTNGTEMLVPIFQQIYKDLGITRRDIGFWCSGSSDYMSGRAFSFISSVDAIGAVPPIDESHVEMDGAWAMYEAYVKLKTGETDTALAYGFGKSSAGNLRRTLALQTDPYVVAPLWPDSLALAGMQARLGLDAGLWDEAAMAEVAARSRRDAVGNPAAQFAGSRAPDGTVTDDVTAEQLLAQPMLADPLRRHDIAPVTDGAAAIVLASGRRAFALCDNPAWITGFEHIIDSAELGGRDLTTAPSAAAAGERATGGDVAGITMAELHAPFTHQELILRSALGLDGAADAVAINPSGGPLTGNPMFAAGLQRIGNAARAVIDGGADRALGHATSGPLLQQNLVCVLDGRR